MGVFDDFLNSVLAGAIDLAKNTIGGFVGEAKEDAEDFLQKSADKLKRWTEALATGLLDMDEFSSLVNGQKDLAEMKALQQAGLAAVEVDKFRDKLLSLVVDKAMGLLP